MLINDNDQVSVLEILYVDFTLHELVHNWINVNLNFDDGSNHMLLSLSHCLPIVLYILY